MNAFGLNKLFVVAIIVNKSCIRTHKLVGCQLEAVRHEEVHTSLQH